MLDYFITPVGPLSQNEFTLGFQAGVWKWDSENQNTILISYPVEIQKKDKIQKLWLPIRYYNLLWAMHTNPDFNDAIRDVKIWENDYLPQMLGFSSYSALVEHINSAMRNNLTCNHSQ